MRKNTLLLLSGGLLLALTLSLLQAQILLKADFNGDGTVDFDDFFAFADAFGTKQGDAKFNTKYDLDGKGSVDLSDFFLFAADFGKTSSSSGTSVADQVPAVYKKIYGASDIYLDGDYIVIKIKGLPDHKSPYYNGTQWQGTQYEAYNGTNASFSLAPGRIAEMSYTFKIPRNPKEAATKRATPLGPMGVAVNGVPLFNQYAGNGASLGPQELNTFDQWNGHPTPVNAYHYHAEPWYLTAHKGSDALIGFLLDGFPVYGPVENGVTLTNASLDAYHGHFGATADYPNGIYHYHITAASPYINGGGFFGTSGTVTQ